MNEIPSGLLDHLTLMIIPEGGDLLLCSDVGSLDTSTIPDNHFHGAVVQGTPTPAQSEELLRVLRPGAHALLIAPDRQPTGHTGACNVEDAGFEIRDAFAWVREQGATHYVAKVRTKEERHGGTGGHNNSHPTLKPIKLIERLLEDVPSDAMVGDFFMGAGSTGIATLATGHNFVGIELEQDSLRVADQRIRHHDAKSAGWLRAKIMTTGLEDPEPDPEDLDLDELFGWGDDE